MIDGDLSARLGPHLVSSLATKGYDSLTPVQEAVLDPKLAGHDLRISSQTGSGKTLAIGFTLRDAVVPSERTPDGVARPTAVVIIPTRELAKQVEMELAWLYAPAKVLIACVTGGSSVRDERRALARGPGIVVGTPGRLLDHLNRQSIDLSNAGAIVLDEADRMLDLGFRDDLEAILKHAPEGHRTHLVSATFPREVEALAKRIQSNPARVQGTPLGTANADIDHIVHFVRQDERVDALINLLLSSPDEQVLVFSRTRAEVMRVCEELDEAGFSVDSLSGDMEQDARHRALSAFKHGKVQVLVATDVAARGIDHSDIARVVQLEPPNDADTYTHRSGRTGRAGRKGKSSIMVAQAGWHRLSGLLKRAGVSSRIEAIPTAATIGAAQDERLLLELTAKLEAADAPVDERATRLAAQLVAAGHAERVLAHLIVQTRRASHCPPRDVTPSEPNSTRPSRGPTGPKRNGRSPDGRGSRPQHAAPSPSRFQDGPRGPAQPRFQDGPRGPAQPREDGPRGSGPRFQGSPAGFAQDAPRPFAVRNAAYGAPEDAPRGRNDQGDDADSWVRFRVTWGEAQGADARRLVPMLCRRGKIRGTDIGAIRVTPSFSLVDVAVHVAADFETATRRRDPRDPAVLVSRDVPARRAAPGAWAASES